MDSRPFFNRPLQTGNQLAGCQCLLAAVRPLNVLVCAPSSLCCCLSWKALLAFKRAVTVFCGRSLKDFSQVGKEKKCVFSVSYRAGSGWRTFSSIFYTPRICAALQQGPDHSLISISLTNHSRSYSLRARFLSFCRLNPPIYPNVSLRFIRARIPGLVVPPAFTCIQLVPEAWLPNELFLSLV